MDVDVEGANDSVSGAGAAADGDHTPVCSPLRSTLSAQPGMQHTTHARRLKEYTRHRRTQDYRQLVDKLSFESAEYDRHRVTPGIDVWRVLGAAHADPSPSQHAEVVTRLPCRVRVPPTLLMRPAASDVFFYTDARGFLTRVDNASMRCFKALLRAEARHGDARHRERCDASEGRRTYSSVAPAHKPSSRLSSATGWVPSAGDAAPCVTIAVEASQQVAGVLLLPHGRGDSCVTSFSVSATVDGVAYARVDDGTEYACSAWGTDTPQEILFQAPVAATGIRLHPLTWRGSYLGVRVGLVVEPARRQGQGVGRPHSVQYPVAVLKTCVGKQSSSVCQALFTTEMTKANSSATDPQVLQEYVRSKGAYTTYYRCVWKPFADSHAYVVASRHRVDDRSQGSQAQFLATQTADQRLNMFRLRYSACREICEHTSSVAKLLAPCLNAFGAIETLVTDWVRDADDTWWMLQIKGWRLRPAAPGAGPSSGAAKKSKKDAMRDANRRCGMCRKRVPTEARVTIAMINHTVRLLKAKGAWKHTHTIPTESGNNKYLTTGVCAACYKAYHREERAERLDAQLSAALGVSVSTELDRDANVEACAVPQEAPSDSFAKVVAAAALGRQVPRATQADVHQWQLLLYFDRLYNLPSTLIPSRLSLVVPGLLGITDTVPVPSDSPFLASATVPIRALKVRCFYTETRNLDGSEPASPRLDPAVCRFLHAQQSVRVRLYYKTGPLPDERTLLGEASFPLQQLSSGVVTKFSMLRMFSSTALGTCSLRLKVGLVRSSLRMTTGEKVVRHTDSGLYVPQHPVYAINALPAEWREVLAAEVAEQRSRPFGTHDGGGGGGGGQLLIGAGDGDDLQPPPPPPPPVPPPPQEGKSRPPLAYAAGCLRCSKSTRFQALCVAATGAALAVASATVVVASALTSALGLRTGEEADRSDFIDDIFRDTIEVCRPKRAAAKRAAPGPPEPCEVCARSLGGLKGEQARAKRMLEYVCGGVDTDDRFKKLEQEHVVKAGQRRRVLRNTRRGSFRRTSQPHPPALSPSSTAFAGPESLAASAASAAAATTAASSQLTLTERLLRIVPPRRACPGAAAAASAGSAAAAAAPPPSTAVAAWTGGASSERPQLKFGGCVQVTECRTDAELELPARFAAWRFHVSVRAVYGDLSGDVDPDTTWVTRYTLFGKEVSHKGFRLVESGPLLLQGDTTTYLFCHNNKTLVNYLRDAGDVLRVVVHREFEGDHCLLADVPLAAIEEALLSKRPQVPAVAGLFPLHKPSGLRAGVLDDLKVADASDSDDDGVRRAACEERRRVWRRRESGDEGDESSEGEEEEEERLRAGSARQRRVLARRACNDDSDDGNTQAADAQLGASDVVECPAAPHLDVCITACTTELLLSSVQVLRDLRPKHDIAIVSAGDQEEE